MDKKKLIVLVFLSMFWVSVFPKLALGAPDVDYTFEKDVLIERANINSYDDEKNIRSLSEYTNNYSGSYSFYNESAGTSGTDIVFINEATLDSDCFVQVNSSINEHDKVLMLFDNTAGGQILTYHYFDSARTSGSIEVWMRTSDVTLETNFRLWDEVGGSNQAVLLRFDASNLQTRQVGLGWENIAPVSNNRWYHLRLDFYCANDTYNVFFSNVSYGNFAFRNPVASIDRLYFYTTDADNGYYSYYDAFGFDWLSNYSSGQNILPYLDVNSTIKEVNRYEFAMQSLNTLNPVASSNPNGWTDVETNGGLAFIVAGFESNDREVWISTANNGDIAGLQKDNIGLTGNYINTSFGVTLLDNNGINNVFSIVLKSSDNSDITALQIDFNGFTLDYWDGSFHELRNDLALDKYYEFNMLLNYELDKCFLDYSVNGSLIAQYDYPLALTGRGGLKKVDVLDYSFGHSAIIFLDYIGILENGASRSSELAWTALYLNVTAWNYEHNNLFSITANGNFYLGSVQGGYGVGEPYKTINSLKNYYNVLELQNIYDNYVSDVLDPTIIMTFGNCDFNVSYFNIEGAKLTQGSTEYFLEYSHSGIVTNESYFYVDAVNRLRFIHNASDSNLEYIQARFNITDLSSTERAVSFKGSIEDNAYGYVRVNMTSIYNEVQIPLIEKTTRAILSQNKTIIELIVLITDNDDDSVSGLTAGMVYNLSLISISNIGASITTLSLIEMMIPLIIILTPTFLLSAKLGKMGIIPLFILFSLVCTIVELIPIWLMFVIGIASSMFLMRRREVGV